MTEKRLNQLLLCVFIAAIAIAIGLSTTLEGDDVGAVKLAFIRYLLQLAVVIVVGGVVGSLFKLREHTRAKEEAILRSQALLLDDISTTILTYQTLAADVTWFKDAESKDEEMHEITFKRYNERVVDLVSQWRALAAKSQTLVSPHVSQKITGFLNRIFVEQDTPMMRLHRDKATDDAWQQQHKKNVEMITEANLLIAEIANDMNISKNTLAG